ncbi:hypothetical protein D3C84_865140 [compost metagenome]
MRQGAAGLRVGIRAAGGDVSPKHGHFSAIGQHEFAVLPFEIVLIGDERNSSGRNRGGAGRRGAGVEYFQLVACGSRPFPRGGPLFADGVSWKRPGRVVAGLLEGADTALIARTAEVLLDQFQRYPATLLQSCQSRIGAVARSGVAEHLQHA